MTTAIDIITRALVDAGELEAGTAPEAEDAVDGLAALNEMVNGWENAGIHIGWSDVGQDAELLVHDKYLEGIRYNLTIRFAATYGLPLDPLFHELALAAYKMFQLNTFEYDADMEVDRALHPRYFTRRVGAYDIENDA